MSATLLQIFWEEFASVSEQLEAVGVRLMEEPRTADLDEAFRAMHTLKGNCYAMGFAGMGQVVHSFEDVLRQLKEAAAVPPPSTGALLLAVNDQLRGMAREPQGPAPEALLQRIAALTHAAGGGAAQPAPGTAPTVGAAVPMLAAAEPKQTLTVAVDVDHLDALFAQSEALRARLVSDGHSLLARQAEAISRQLLGVRSTRIAKIVPRLRRVVVEATRAVGKPVALQVNGEDTSADLAVVQDLAVVLPHMLRNSVDHGIEPARQREERGKPADGQLRLDFVQEPGALVVVVADDGQGLDPEVLASAAVRKGILPAAEAIALTREEKLRLIFRPGFSTSAQLSAVSGRGVGMDIVATTVERHRGRVELRSVAGQGARFELRFPVLFRWEEHLVVELDHRRVGVPVRDVVHVLTASEAPAVQAGRIVYGGGSVPVIGFAEMDPRLGSERPRPLLILGLGGTRVALAVDGLHGFAGTLIQALPTREARPHLAGLGQTTDGQVLWALDLEDVLRAPAAYTLPSG